jgi:hypothetical protein
MTVITTVPWKSIIRSVIVSPGPDGWKIVVPSVLRIQEEFQSFPRSPLLYCNHLQEWRIHGGDCLLGTANARARKWHANVANARKSQRNDLSDSFGIHYERIVYVQSFQGSILKWINILDIHRHVRVCKSGYWLTATDIPLNVTIVGDGVGPLTLDLGGASNLTLLAKEGCYQGWWGNENRVTEIGAAQNEGNVLSLSNASLSFSKVPDGWKICGYFQAFAGTSRIATMYNICICASLTSS